MKKDPKIKVRQGITITGPTLWEKLVKEARYHAPSNILDALDTALHGMKVYGTAINDHGQPQQYRLQYSLFGGAAVFEPVVYH